MTLIPLLAPLALLAAALVSVRRPAARGSAMVRLPEFAALFALAIAAISALALIAGGAATSPLIGAGGIGLSVRLDAVSSVMMLLVGFVGWIVVRYATTYLDGEPAQGRFLAWLSGVLAAVLLLVMSGNLVQLVIAWGAIGITLRRCLLFRADRAPARRAARKKGWTAIFAMAALLPGAIVLGVAYGTTDIATILAAAKLGDVPTGALWAAALFALAAVLKTALVPFHGWLTGVVDAPTPVSALLHAGVINAGGFLLIRFADIVVAAPGVMAALVTIGGFSAIFGGLVMLTQPAVKTSLAWSTLGQMGFMIMQIGLGLFPLALLHIVAHSLYKAHAFLSSGGAVEQVLATRRPGPVAVPDGRAVLKSFGLAIGVYAVGALVFGLAGKSPQAIALGAILIFGIAYLVAQGLAGAAPKGLTRRMLIYALAATVGYFALQSIAAALTAGVLPPAPIPGALEWTLLVLALVTFGLTAIAQATFPLWATHPSMTGLRIHLLNGFYLDAVADRLTGNWAAQQSKRS